MLARWPVWRPAAATLLATVLPMAFVGCGGSPIAPGDTSEVPPDFILITGFNVIAIGQTAALQVTSWYRGDRFTFFEGGQSGQPIDVTRHATWWSAYSTIASASSSGWVKATSVGTTEISASYRGVTYSLPLFVVRDAPGQFQEYAGTWQGQYTRTCERIVGIGRHEWCNFQGGPVVYTESISLAMSVEGNTLRGTVGFPWGAADVRAGVLEGGELVIGGTERSGEHVGGEQIREWRLTLSPDRGLTGSGVSDRAYRNIYGVQLDRQRYDVKGLTRVN